MQKTHALIPRKHAALQFIELFSAVAALKVTKTPN